MLPLLLSNKHLELLDNQNTSPMPNVLHHSHYLVAILLLEVEKAADFHPINSISWLTGFKLHDKFVEGLHLNEL